MNLNNIFKKVSGIALAGAIAFAGFAGSANAASGAINTKGSSDALTSTPEISKEVTGAEYFGGGTFTYTLTAEEAPSYTGFAPRTSKTPLIGLTDGKIEIAGGQTTGTEAITVNQDAVDKAQPGVYRYQIKEEASGIAGMTDDTRTFDVDVFVTSDNGTGRKIAYYIVSVDGQKAELKFTNKLTQEDLKITKTITGNQANLSDTFKFTIKVNSKSNTSVRYTTANVSDPKTDQAVTTGSAFTVDGVTNKSTITLTGLAADDTVTITESDAKDGGYKANVSGGLTLSGADVDKNEATGTATITAGIADIAWENSRTADIPTGLIENIAPFVIAIAAAGIVFFIYFKRDKDEEGQYA